MAKSISVCTGDSDTIACGGSLSAAESTVDPSVAPPVGAGVVDPAAGSMVVASADGVSVTPEVVVAVAVAFVITYVLPAPGPKEKDVVPA